MRLQHIIQSIEEKCTSENIITFMYDARPVPIFVLTFEDGTKMIIHREVLEDDDIDGVEMDAPCNTDMGCGIGIQGTRHHWNPPTRRRPGVRGR